MTSPYEGLEERAFWRTGVSNRDTSDPGDLYRPKFKVTKKHRVVTAGSCFAQHVGRTLKAANYNVVDLEPLPSTMQSGLDAEVAQAHGYGLYSARYGNIYTARQLLQLLEEALGQRKPDCLIWEKAGRFYDALRPSIEPGGFATREEVALHRTWHLGVIRSLLNQLDVLVFTFGLTEAWVSRLDGTVYPTAPGTIAGEFDPKLFEFKNFTHVEVIGDFQKVRKIVRSFNPRARFIVTVSPVPLTATASGQHVEVATSYSKAVLRSVCGVLYERCGDIDYFPSYEVITSQMAGGRYFESNRRNVTKIGVQTAMGLFMAAHSPDYLENVRLLRGVTPTHSLLEAKDDPQEELICEDALLEAFNL